MTDEDAGRTELRRIKRVADQSCSAHARLRDRYATRATILDVLILGASAWVLALSFVDPSVIPKLTPQPFAPAIWTGFMGVSIFVATLLQLKLDLRGRADAHRRAFDAQAEVKRAANEAEAHMEDEGRRAEVQAKISVASAIGVIIPEREFLRQKQLHLKKIAASKHLDAQPYASLFIFGLRAWFSDTFPAKHSSE
jgi:hypothetical protein